jgi:hypothetical protein
MNKPSLATKKKNITLTLNQPKKNGDTKTVIVLGVERGGTSMAAGVIRALGIDMGRRAGLNHEDPLFLTDEKDRLKNRINMRNKESDVWGFKVPKASLQLDFYDKHLRNPYYIVVYRNSLAVADSWMQRGAGSMIDVLERTFSYQEALLKHFRNTKNPVLMLNYERAVQDQNAKDQLIGEIAGFLGIELTDELRERSAGMMTGDGKGYVNLPEHYFSGVVKDTAEIGSEYAIEEASPELRNDQGWIVHDKPKPQLIYRLAGGGEQNLPKAFWLELDLEVDRRVDLLIRPIRLYFNFIGEYFPGHCTRPELKSGKNWLYVETSGNAVDFAFGPISVPMRFKIDAKMYAIGK